MKARTAIRVALLCAARFTLSPRKPILPTLKLVASGTGKTVAWPGLASQGSTVVELKKLFSNQDAERARKMLHSSSMIRPGRVVIVEPTPILQATNARLSRLEAGA